MLRPVYKIKNLETLNDIYYSISKKILTGLKFFYLEKDLWQLVLVMHVVL